MNSNSAVFQRVPFWRFLMISIIISALTDGLGQFVNSMCAFVLARLKLRGQGIILIIIIATLIAPFETLALPLLWSVSLLPCYDGSVGWLDTNEAQFYATLITVPVLVLFIAFQRSFINSIASSGGKG